MQKSHNQIPLFLLFALFAVSHTTEVLCTASLPAIAYEFNVTSNIAQKSSSVYFAGFALGILSLGRISDVIGRRPVALFGIALYTIASAACAFASSIEYLLCLRFLQAFGVSVGSVIAQAMARDSYSGNELSKVYVSISICLSFVPSLGSILGGYIVEYASWYHSFLALAIMSTILFITCVAKMPETNRYMAVAKSNRYLVILKSVLSDKVVMLYALIVGSFNGMMFGFYTEAPFIFITKYHFSPSSYGKLGLLITTAYITGGLISRYLVTIYSDNNKIITIGLRLSVCSCLTLLLGLSSISQNCSEIIVILVVFVPMMVHIIGHSLVIPIILRYALEGYKKVTGSAGSIFGFTYYSIVAVINYIVSYIHAESAIPFAMLFAILSSICYCAFYIILRYKKLTETQY